MKDEVQYSKFDWKIKVKIPSLDNKLLAYETGVHIGDGSLQIVKSGTHSVRFWGHGTKDWMFVSEILPSVIKELYNKDVVARKCNDSNKCVLAVCSKAIATFKKNILNLPVGKKEQLKALPEFVKKNKSLLISCLRGIADTDFSLYYQKDGTPVITCTMSNRNLIVDIANELNILGFNVKVKLDIKRMKKDKEHFEHKINLYGKKNLEKWIKIIGFSNPAYFRVLDKNDIFSTLKRRPRGALR